VFPGWRHGAPADDRAARSMAAIARLPVTIIIPSVNVAGNAARCRVEPAAVLINAGSGLFPRDANLLYAIKTPIVCPWRASYRE
jgi:hypothetical protein